MSKRKISLVVPDEIIMSKIYFIRSQKIMLDRDLAELYGVETKTFNQAVKRNQKRFPSDFMFELSKKEWTNLRSQFVTSSWGGTRYVPSAFSEQGVAMLSSILNSDKAININIRIIRVFTRVRQMLLDNSELRLAIEELRMTSNEHSKNIGVLFQYLDGLIKNKKNTEPRKLIGYKIPPKKNKS